MPSPEIWLIAAAIIWPDGVQDVYLPTTEFPGLAACQQEINAINRDWAAAGIKGFVTCRQPPQNVGDN
jgi:hypothetical protein